MKPFVCHPAAKTYYPALLDSLNQMILAPFTTGDETYAQRYAELAADLNQHDSLKEVVWPRRVDPAATEEVMAYTVPDELKNVLTDVHNPGHILAMRYLREVCLERRAYLSDLLADAVSAAEDRSGVICGDFPSYEDFVDELIRHRHETEALPIIGWLERFKDENKACDELINQIYTHLTHIGGCND